MNRGQAIAIAMTMASMPRVLVAGQSSRVSTHLPLSDSSSRLPHSPGHVPSAGRGEVCSDAKQSDFPLRVICKNQIENLS